MTAQVIDLTRARFQLARTKAALIEEAFREQELLGEEPSFTRAQDRVAEWLAMLRKENRK